MGLARRKLGLGARELDACAETGRRMGVRTLGWEWPSLPLHPRPLAAVKARAANGT